MWPLVGCGAKPCTQTSVIPLELDELEELELLELDELELEEVLDELLELEELLELDELLVPPQPVIKALASPSPIK